MAYKNPEAARAYEKKRREARRADYLVNREEILAKGRAKYAENIEAQRERSRASSRKLRAGKRALGIKRTDKQKESDSASRRKRETGHTREYFLRTLEAQGFCCALCSAKLDPKSRNTHADHDHSTGKPRGVLCPRCNTQLGVIERRADLCLPALKLLEYLAAFAPVSEKRSTCLGARCTEQTQ